jgi:Acyl-CoA thioester hydrolase/BAAT N-terminal region/BAAT / Acyl-CoA thioester hydrolase C terminal
MPLRRVAAWCGVAVLAVGLVGGCTGRTAASSPSLVVTPATALTDAAVQVQLSGLPSNALITVTASCIDHKGVLWQDSAVYRSSAGGGLSLDQAPVSGAYRGSNPMGLFELMQPPATTLDAETDLVTGGDQFQVRLTASVHGKQVASTEVRRLLPWAKSLPAGPIVLAFKVATHGMYAHEFLPRDATGLRPAVLLFGSSTSGANFDEVAGLLASHGYPTMSLAYLKEPGLPTTLQDVPLEYFTRALRVLGGAPAVDPSHVLVLSYGRGSEAALLLAAHFPELVYGAIVGSPSLLVHPGIPTGKPAWLLNGAPLPSANWQIKEPAQAPQAIIPVERIRGPLLMTCSRHDTYWNSCAQLDAITARLASHGFGHSVTPLTFPGGYLANLPTPYYSGIAHDFQVTGGSAEEDETSEIDFYRKILDFLKTIPSR